MYKSKAIQTFSTTVYLQKIVEYLPIKKLRLPLVQKQP